MTSFTGNNGLVYTTLSNTEVKVGGKDTSISHNACPSSCPSSIVIPSTVSYGGKTYTVTRIGICAFFEWTSVSSISIAPTVKYIDDNSFDRMHVKLNSVVLPQGLKRVGHFAFASSDIKSFNIPNSVTDLGQCPFGFNHDLTTITIESGNKYFSVNNVGLFDYDKKRFIQCFPKVTSINLPDTVTVIGHYSVTCSIAENVVIPIRVKVIDDIMFYANPSLKNIYIYGNLKFVFETLIVDCAALANIYYYGSYPVTKQVNTIANNAVLHVCEKYKGNAIFGKTSYKVEYCYALSSICRTIRNAKKLSFVELCTSLIFLFAK